MRKLSVILCGLLLLGAVGCGPASNSSSDPASYEATPESEAQPAPEEEIAPEREAVAKDYSTTDGTMKLDIAFDKDVFTHEDIIVANITLTNESSGKIAYVQGSGSAVAPDALTIDLGGIAKLYEPLAMTMDYRVEILEPGQSFALELPFAPYIAKDQDKPIPPEYDIEDFKTDAFDPAPSGTIDSAVTFEYTVLPEDADDTELLVDFDNLPQATIEQPVQIAIA